MLPFRCQGFLNDRKISDNSFRVKVPADSRLGCFLANGLPKRQRLRLPWNLTAFGARAAASTSRRGDHGDGWLGPHDRDGIPSFFPKTGDAFSKRVQCDW